jgi:hypothetical protein
MKYIPISFLSLLLLFSCAQNGSAQGNASTKPPVRKFKHNSKVETIYDKAKDQTTTYLRPMTLRSVKSSIEARMISEGKTDFLPAEVLSMTAYFNSAGKGLTKPQFVVIGFRSMALDQTKYTDNRALAVILDGSSMDLGTMQILERRIDSLGPYQYNVESLELPVPYESFLRITTAKKVTVRLATTDLELKDQHLEALRDLISRVE